MPGTGRFTLAQKQAVLVTAWLSAGLAATYRVRVLELNTSSTLTSAQAETCKSAHLSEGLSTFPALQVSLTETSPYSASLNYPKNISTPSL